jgi:allantoinase
MRDLLGYGTKRPDPNWPEGARLAVSVVVNVEEGAELSLSLGDERNEGVYEVVEEVEGVVDQCKDTHFDYGTRVGYHRIMALLEQYEVPATMNCCARALELSPWLGRDALARGHEISCHSFRWEGHARMAIDAERDVIARSINTIRDACGVRPVGWHTRSAPSPNTRQLLVEEGGFLYDSDAYGDDLPYVVQVDGHDHVILPYAFDTNDMRFTRQGGFVHGDDFSRYCIDAMDWMLREGSYQPAMLSIGLHLRIIGRPGRMAGLEAVLQAIRDRPGVWLARRDTIAHHWREVAGLPAWEAR